MSDDIKTELFKNFAWMKRSANLEGIILGAIYGVILRLAMIFTWGNSGTFGVMTLAFLCLGPIVIGILTIRRAQAPVSIWKWVFFPWISVGIMLLTVWLFAIEGFICIAMATPISLVCASLGGIIGGLSTKHGNEPTNKTLTCLAVLPILLASVEARLNAPLSTRTVGSEIRIHASRANVWQNIERVPPIAPAELQPTWSHRIGFPRPIEATLSYKGVGGVRHATFEHGLTFIETVTAWQPEHQLAFTIKADSASIPTTTLDEHVTIGGRYFDVLNGEYDLEQLPNGDILLHLTSHQRLSTDFNGYAGLWTDAIMQNLQTSILQVIKNRCEQLDTINPAKS